VYEADNVRCPQCGRNPLKPTAKVIPFRPRRRDGRDGGRDPRNAKEGRRQRPRPPVFPSSVHVRWIWALIVLAALLLPYVWRH